MADIQTITVGGTKYNVKDAGAQRTLPTTTTANLFLKSTATAGTVTWGSGGGSSYTAASNGGLSLSGSAFSMAAQTGVYVGASTTTPPDYAAIWIQP